jgi:hypothetical protein
MNTKKDTSIGTRHGQLVIVDRIFNGKRTMLYCVCDCGNKTDVLTYQIGGKTKSCGCLKVSLTKLAKTTHGQTSSRTKTATYATWASIKLRCNNSKQTNYHLYGGRGITYCERWEKFENFLEDMGEKPDGLSIERIDVNGNYEPNNCKWATNAEQALNKRNTINLEYGGIVKPLQLWAKEYGIKPNVLRQRLVRDGLSIHRALHKKATRGAV